MNFWNLQGGWRCGARVSCLGAFVSVCCGDVGMWIEAQFRNSGSGCVRHGGGVEAVRRADGVALALRSVSSLDVAVETVGEFCKRAGSGVDVGKTRCMLLGGLRDGCGGVVGVDITSDAVGCLGICIGHSGNRCCELGWLHSFRSVERLFESWRERGLAVFAKACIVDSLAVSEVVCVGSVLPVPDPGCVKQLKGGGFGFVWNRGDGVGRDAVVGGRGDGDVGVFGVWSGLGGLGGCVVWSLGWQGVRSWQGG